MPLEKFDVEGSALLVMDYENDVLQSLPSHIANERLTTVSALLTAARSAGLSVIYVVVRYRSGYPDASSNNKRVSMLRDNGKLGEGTPGAAVHSQVAPQADEPVVVKRRVSALAHTDLSTLLSSAGIRTLVLVGLTTTGVVTSTVRHAADDDYALVVVEDGCADPNAEAHRVLMQDVFPLQAEVVSSAELIAVLGAQH